MLPSRLPVRESARACVGACALAAAELGARRTGGGVPAVRVDDGAVATAFVSERHLLVGGRAPETFAPLSRFWRTADGWVRTHANYPHHRARLLAALGVPKDPGRWRRRSRSAPRGRRGGGVRGRGPGRRPAVARDCGRRTSRAWRCRRPLWSVSGWTRPPRGCSLR
ncbi:hypothetical protein GCM10023238_02110 [Streptomyces heliomycini]